MVERVLSVQGVLGSIPSTSIKKKNRWRGKQVSDASEDLQLLPRRGSHFNRAQS